VFEDIIKESQANFNKKNRKSKILLSLKEYSELMRISIDRNVRMSNRQTCYHGAAHFEDRPNGNEELPLDPRGLVVDVEFDPTNARVRHRKELRNSNALRKLTDRSLWSQL
jgi:hypothetical protein